MIPTRKLRRWCSLIRVKAIIPPGEFPLIDKLPSMMTKLAMLLCAGFAKLLPSYKAAEKITGGYLGMKVSDTYIELVTGYAGGARI